MPTPLTLAHSPRARRWVVCCLMLVPPLHGWAALTVQWLGARHFHQQAAEDAGALMSAWHYFGRVDGAAGPALAIVHDHMHHDLARHHHDRAEPGLVLADPAADAPAGDAAAMSLAAAQPCSVNAAELTIKPAPRTAQACPEYRSMRIMSWDPQRDERPPRG
jgi:hypothetical protein